MIDLTSGHIYLEGHRHQITSYEVWWIVPEGLCVSLPEALADATRLNFDPVMIKPICVAVSRKETLNGIVTAEICAYEIFTR